MVIYNNSSRTIINVQLAVLFLLLAAVNQGGAMLMQRGFNKEEGDGMVGESAVIGSSPPRCKGICHNCGPCEAVQVPATPEETKAAANSKMRTCGRGDESSNYKPINWKCKCGNFIFNP